VFTYDPKQVSISILAPAELGLEVSTISVTDYAEGSFIRVSRSRPMWAKRVGSTGTTTRNKSNDRSGSVTIELEAGSPINLYLSRLAKADEDTNKGLCGLLMKDANGGDNAQDLVTAKNAWLVGPPDMTKAMESGTVAWIFDCDELDVVHGGLSEA
jgi:hypothetical protein